MLLTLPGTPSSFTLIPTLQYGEVPGMPPWSAPLYLDMLCPAPLPTTPAPAIIYLHGGAWAEGERSIGLYPWLNPHAYHNLCHEELLPWTDEPWEEMGWKALAFFRQHLSQ